MSSPECRRSREHVGAYALGHLDADEAAVLEAHLDGCADCRAEADELRQVARLLPEADPARVADEPAVPRGLGRQVFERIGEERRAARVRRRRLSLGALGAAATAAAAAVVALSNPLAESPNAGLALTSFEAGAEGTVDLEPRPWGSQIELETSGLPAGVYNVWLERPDGTRHPAGSFRSVPGDPVRVVLATSMPTDRAQAVGVSGPRGRTMLYARV